MPSLQRFFCLVIGYLFGNVLTASLVARGLGGNPGMANVTARRGPAAGALVLLGDVLKTVLAVALCRLWFPIPGGLAALYAGLGAALGHDFPFWRRFRGGKGVAVTCTAAVLYSPAAGLSACLCGLAAILIARRLRPGAVAIAAAFPALTLACGGSAESAAVAAALGGLMLLRFFRQHHGA